MKFMFALYLTLVAVVSITHSSSIAPEEAAQSDIEAYIVEQFSHLRASRGGSTTQACYTKYLPQLQDVTDRSQTDSQQCSTTATSRKNDVLQKLSKDRSKFNPELVSIVAGINQCLDKSDDIEYFSCFNNNVMEHTAISTIVNSFPNIYTSFATTLKSIDTSENNCINNVFSKAKSDTDDLFAALQSCLVTGANVQQPEPQPDPQPEPEPQPETSESP